MYSPDNCFNDTIVDINAPGDLLLCAGPACTSDSSRGRGHTAE